MRGLGAAVRTGVLGLGLALAMAAAPAAWANGRPAASTTTTLEPGGPQRMLVGTTFGLVLSSDGGATWHWICEGSAYAGTNLGTYDPRFVFSPSGALFGALSSGLSISRDGGCSFRLAGDVLAGMWASDVAVSPADPRTIYVVTSSTGRQNGLFISHDEGQTFTAVSPLDSVSFYRRVVAFGQDAYISGHDEMGGGHIHLWKYAGAQGTLTEVTPGGDLASALPLAEYVGASQRTAGLLYLSAGVAPPDGGGLAARGLFKSVDGGATWLRVFTTNDLRGAVLDANDKLFVATLDGIFSSATGEPPFSRGAFDRLYTCLGTRGATLYGCVAYGGNFAYGQSSDGTTWSSLLDFHTNLSGPLTCAAGTATHDLCEPLWPGLMTQLGIGQGTGGLADAGAGFQRPDAGVAGGGGGGCAVGGTVVAGAGLMLALALVGLLLRGPRA